MRKVDVPEPNVGEIRIRVQAASVCGSDLHAYNYDSSYSFMRVPVILGHEFAGTIDAVGDGVDTAVLGERVIAEANLFCGICSTCVSGKNHICENFKIHGFHINGGFAEYLCVNQEFIHRIPEEIGIEQASLIEPLSVSVHAVYDRSNIKNGDHVAIFGPGPIGLLTAQVVRCKGGIPVLFGIDSDEQCRLPVARSLGISTVDTSKKSLEQILVNQNFSSFDQVIDCSGSSAAVETGLNGLKKGGQLILVGIFPSLSNMDLSKIVRREVTIGGSHTSTRENYKQSIELLANGQINTDQLVTYYQLEEYERAFQDAVTKKVIKPVLHI
ncbi:alcohol dehydrogenase catalytic domain-containing protein [Paenibacillus frigoriresistens]|nr:alcohol dehydrogenase catalytic domain-containing protein [Paenibacillus frigoriresistens]